MADNLSAEAKTPERKQAEYEYSISAFDYASNPVGSRDWMLFWSGYQAAARTQADAGKEREQYNELLYAVSRKFPGESRHETALQYIRAAEAPSSSLVQSTTKPENT